MNASLLCDLTANPSTGRVQLGGQASCGFPSPAADYQEPDLSLDALVDIRPTSSIFLLRAWGESMKDAGIHDGDVLVVDKALDARRGDIVVAVLGAEFVVKRLDYDTDGVLALCAENPDYAPIRVADGESVEVWGVCTWVLHSLRNRCAAPRTRNLRQGL